MNEQIRNAIENSIAYKEIKGLCDKYDWELFRCLRSKEGEYRIVLAPGKSYSIFSGPDVVSVRADDFHSDWSDIKSYSVHVKTTTIGELEVGTDKFENYLDEVRKIGFVAKELKAKLDLLQPEHFYQRVA